MDRAVPCRFGFRGPAFREFVNAGGGGTPLLYIPGVQVKDDHVASDESTGPDALRMQASLAPRLRTRIKEVFAQTLAVCVCSHYPTL